MKYENQYKREDSIIKYERNNVKYNVDKEKVLQKFHHVDKDERLNTVGLPNFTTYF